MSIQLASDLNVFTDYINTVLLTGGFKNTDLGQFSLANIELLIKRNLLQKKLIKPLYLS